jgi:hypothetical protein
VFLNDRPPLKQVLVSPSHDAGGIRRLRALRLEVAQRIQSRVLTWRHLLGPGRAQPTGGRSLDLSLPLVMRHLLPKGLHVPAQSLLFDPFLRFLVNLLMPLGEPPNYGRRHPPDFKIPRVVFEFIAEQAETLGEFMIFYAGKHAHLCSHCRKAVFSLQYSTDWIFLNLEKDR